MKPISKRTLLSGLLALSLLLLAACGSTPQPVSDPIDDLATLADGEGNLETNIEIVSVGSSNAQAQAETVYLYFKATYKGKNLQGFIPPETGQDLFDYQRVSAAIAKGDKPQIRGRVRNVGGVSVFIGLMRSQPSGTAAAAAIAPTPVMMLAEGKTLPAKTQATITLSDVLVSSYAIEIGGVSAGWLRTPNGQSVASYQIVSPRDPASGLPTGVVFQAKLSGKIEAVQTQMGVVGRLTGTLTIGQKTVSIEGIAAMDDWMPQV